MSKAKELAEKLAKLDIANMYENDFFLTWEKTDDEIAAIFTVADALRDLRERNKSTKIFDSGLVSRSSETIRHVQDSHLQVHATCSDLRYRTSMRKSRRSLTERQFVRQLP